MISTKVQSIKQRKGEAFQQMLEFFNIQKEREQAYPIPHSIYRIQLKMNYRLKVKVNLNILEENIKEHFCDLD